MAVGCDNAFKASVKSYWAANFFTSTMFLLG